jgi:diguanylate cyclase (GGDEF)-like protein
VYGLSHNETESSSGTQLLSRVLDGLEGLNQTPVGRVIHDQIARVVAEHAEAQQRLTQTYSLLVHLLLDAYARDPVPEHVTRLNARLIELRQSGASGALDTGAAVTPSQSEMPPSPEPVAKVAASSEQGPYPPSSAAHEVPVQPAPVSAEKIQAKADGHGAHVDTSANEEPQIERRVNSAYRLHLDRKRDEIEKLQEALARNVTDTISQNREFGALLQIELRALQQADGSQEIENLRQILIGGIEELIQGQRLLDTKLNRTADYLDLVKSDSERLRDELHKVRLLSLTDEFTGLPNRRAFMRRLQDEIGRAMRYGTTLAMALIDLDSFKAINDQYGHAAGDEILRAYASEVLSILRHHDLAARYGGEEFAILLPNTNEDGAVAALNKVRQRARDIRCTHGGRDLPMPTFSAGVTTYASGESYTTFIDRADRALYHAKNLGRNRVEIESAPADMSVSVSGTVTAGDHIP